MSSQIMSHPSPMPHVLPHEDTIRKQVLETHKPDGRNINVRRILDVVENILNSQTEADGATLEERLRQPLDYDNMEILFKIQQLSCQVASEWSGDVGLYVMTINLLTMLSTYEWEAKAVMMLAAFANNHGDLCILTQASNQSRLAKRVSLLKQSTAPHPNDTTFDDRQKSIVESIKSILNLTNRMLKLKECPPQFIPHFLDSDVLSSALYHITQALLICASLLKSFGVAQSEIPAEPVELHILKMSFQHMDMELQVLLNDCHKKIEEKEVQESYKELKLAFSQRDHSDNNKDILKLLFNVKDEQNMPLYHGETKAEAKLDDLPTGNNVLLLISSGLDISKERAAYLGKVYKDCQNHGMIWIPVVNAPKEFWTAEKVNEFESLLALMGLYSVKDPRKSVAAGLHKYVEEDLFQSGEKDFFRIGKEPIVVVLDYKGKFAHKNAMGMILTWGADASPFDTYKEECLWREETWGTALVAGSIDPIRQWINAYTQGAKKDCIFLYGGNDIEWVRQFKIEVEKTLSSDIEPRMMYVGRNKEVRSSIAPSDCLDGPSTWLFWARLKSTLLSRMHYLSKTSLKEDDDEIVEGLKKLLANKAIGEIGGWCLLCTKDKVVRCGNGAIMLRVVTEYKDWKEYVTDKNEDLFEVFDEIYVYHSFTSHHQPCCELEYPSELEYPTTFTEIPQSEKCPDWHTNMYKLITFTCCHSHDDYDLEEKEEDDATNK